MVQTSKMKLEEFSDIWMDEYVIPELASRTREKEECNLKNYVLPFIGKERINEITPLKIQRFINKLKKKKKIRPTKYDTSEYISSTTVNEGYKTLNKMLNKCVEWELLEYNPADKVKAPSVDSEEKETFNKKQLLSLLEEILKLEKIVDICLFTIEITTGIRRGELVGLHVDDILLSENKIRIERTAYYDKYEKKMKEKEPKSKKGKREIPIPDFCVSILEKYLKYRERLVKKFHDQGIETVDNLFLSKTGYIMHVDTPAKKWTKYVDDKGIKHVTLHGLRHSYCSVQMNDNTKLSGSEVATIMGHSNLATTYRYTHDNKNKKNEVVEIWDDVDESKSLSI